MSQPGAYTGNSAAAFAFKQVDPDVVAAYPITPSTEVVEFFSQFVADGAVHTEFVPVESEHSALSACIGAAAAGARVLTATSSQGLMLMSELLYVASGLRLPIVLALSNRALSAPLNIHGDHSDAMAVKDCGWIQLFCENAQEVYDTVFQALRIAEHLEVRLPVMVCYDGFTLSHTLERVEVETDERVREFIGKNPKQSPLLDFSKPVSYGPVALPDYYTEHKRQQLEAMQWALDRVIHEVGQEFGRMFGRSYGLLEPYALDDAEFVLVMMGSAAGAAQEAADQLRREGHSVGVLKVRSFRPFPFRRVFQALQKAHAVAVLDRCPVIGGAGPLYQDVLTACSRMEKPPRFFSFVGGLGGRDLPVEAFRKLFLRLEESPDGDGIGTEGAYFDVRSGSPVA